VSGAAPPELDPHPTRLRAEAAALGRHILGRPVDSEFVERYVAAHAHLPLEARDPGDAAVLDFALAHPVFLPCLDAAAALTRPEALLHRKAILLAAILEASPRYADQFLPRTVGWPGLLGLGLGIGMTTAFQLAVGLPVLALVGRRT